MSAAPSEAVLDTTDDRTAGSVATDREDAPERDLRPTITRSAGEARS